MERCQRRMGRPRTAQSPAAIHGGTHVLLIEADPEEQVRLAHLLREAGHRVVAASSASGALALTQQFPVDLVLVSQELPRTTGIDVSDALTQQHPSLPVVVMASEGSPGLVAAAHRAGARDCIARADLPRMLERWRRDAVPGPLAARAEYDLGLAVAAQSAE